jgi:phenylpropionate dioxygenase-like ring-hydroxylating dioxygenase large terminal subunit
MNALLDDRGVTERVFAHIAAGTTDLSDGVWREPVANYRSEERLRTEIAQVLRRMPTPFCPSAALAEPGAFTAREAAGTPLVAVRGGDGVARVFRNACRHRGMRIASGSGCSRAFVCRYHGWSYGLDGRLAHVPHERGFPDLDRAQHGLVPVHAVEERAGLVFVVQDAGGPADAQLSALPPILAGDQRLFGQREARVAANWKIFLEGFLEGYHIRSTHPTTFLPYGFDNLTLIEHFGRNSRVTFPFKRIEQLAAVTEAERRVDGAVTFVYHLFPNVIVAVLSHHTVVSVLEPISLRETRLVTYLLTNRAHTDEQGAAAAARDAAFVGQIGAVEDNEVVCAIQAAIDSGANEHFTYGRFEGAIAHFHRSLGALLGEAGVA